MDITTRQNNALISPDGAMGAMRLSRKGELFTADWLQAAVFEGRAFTVPVGAFSTPIVGGGDGTVLDQDQPELAISVPSGKAILPFCVKAQCVIPALATDLDECEILLAVDKDTEAAAGTATAETPLNLRMQHADVSACTVKSAYTVNATNPTLDIELARAIITGDMNGTPGFAAFWTPLKLDYQPKVVPLLIGPCCLYLYWGGTVAVSGFAQAFWVELNSSLFD
jgi:hypothetical protein